MAKHDAPPGAEENLPPRKRSAKFDSARLRFGVRLRQIRDDLGLSQKAFAELVHELQPSIVRWEKGETIPGFDKVESFAKALGIGVSAFSTAEPYIPESARPAAAADEALSEDIAQLFLSRLRDPHDVLHAELRAHLAPMVVQAVHAAVQAAEMDLKQRLQATDQTLLHVSERLSQIGSLRSDDVIRPPKGKAR